MMKNYKVVGDNGKFYCEEYRQNGLFDERTGWRSCEFQTAEWARHCADLFNRLERDWCFRSNTFSISADDSLATSYVINSSVYSIRNPEPSNWKCFMFGSNGEGITYIPRKGSEPNWFWRKMQYLCFGNKWVKNNE